MSGVVVSANYMYYSGPDGVNLHLGYAPVANEDVTAQGNFMWGGEIGIRLSGLWQRAEVSGNTIGGARHPLADAAVPLARRNLIYADARVPATPTVFVRPNQYEPGRAYIVVYNFGRRASVNADVGKVLSPGQTYELRSVQDVFGPPLARGTYTGDSIPLPLDAAALVPVQPLGRPTATPPLTRPAFDVFVLTIAPR
jgi:hypothetical protein